MSMRKSPKKPLGEILQQAHLISSAQIEEALKEQSQTKEIKLGEILAKRGWIKQETADFFAQNWITLVSQPGKKQKKPLGYYLRQAGLLDEEQIKAIIDEQTQRKLWVRLGASAALKGWLKQTTVDFFLENLFPEHAGDSPFTKSKPSRQPLARRISVSTFK